MSLAAITIVSCSSTKVDSKTDLKMESLRFDAENYTTKTFTVEGKSFSVK